jgi:hypothetical protein
MKIIVPSQELIVPMPEMTLETWGAQIEEAGWDAANGTRSYIASVYFRRKGDNNWQQHTIHTTATEQPKIRIRPDGTFEFTDHPTISSSIATTGAANPRGIASIRGRADQELILGDSKGLYIGPNSPALCYHPPHDTPEKGWKFNAALDNHKLLDGEWSIQPNHLTKKRKVRY